MEAELDVRSWLMASTEHPEPSKRMRQMDMKFKMVGVVRDPKVAASNKAKVCPTPKHTDDMPTPNPRPEITTKQDDEPTPKQTCGTPTPKPDLPLKQGGKKLPKQESLALIRITNKKITDWIKQKPVEVIEMDWSDDSSIPTGMEPMEIERRENARCLAEGWKRKRICRELVLELLTGAESMSASSYIMNMVMEMAWRGFKENTVKDLLVKDKELMEFTANLISSWKVESKRVLECERL